MITRSAAMATLIWTLSSLSSIASDAKLTHLAHLMAEAAVGENAPELAVDLEAGTRLGKVSLRFESTTLAESRQASTNVRVTLTATAPRLLDVVPRRTASPAREAVSAARAASGRARSAIHRKPRRGPRPFANA